MTIKIALVDDHHVFRAGLRAIIGGVRDFSVAGEAADARSAYPLVDENQRCVGIVSRQDLLGPTATPDTPLSQIGSADVVTVTPDDTLLTALERIIDEEVEHLPVLDAAQHIVGMCTRTDILRARSRHRSSEESQAGWHATWRQRRSTRGKRFTARAGSAFPRDVAPLRRSPRPR